MPSPLIKSVIFAFMKQFFQNLSIEPAYLGTNISVILGDTRNILQNLPDKSIQCCITSPPYWGLRDYGIENQIGSENDIVDYITTLVGIFNEIRRILTDDGILWLNIGDSYTSGNRKWRDPDSKNPARGMSYRPPTPDGLKPKDLIGVPWRLALALQMDGWYLRSDIIWNKPNCQPESVKDRPTRSHEYIFLLSKSEKYYFDNESIQVEGMNGIKKNRRTVWDINTVPFSGAHFAVFPPELVKICLQSGTKQGQIVIDPFFGSGTVGQVCTYLERKCIGIEINPEYLEIFQNRMNGNLFL
jgi:DNA modification methylase